jgi:hypothetical protein
MAEMNIPEDIYQRLRDFPDFKDESPESMERSLTESARSLVQMYVAGDTNLFWDTLDKFALHVVSINGLLNETQFSMALADLKQSEAGYDVLSDEQQNTLYAISEHLYSTLVSSNRAEYKKYVALLTDPGNDAAYTMACLQRFRKPSTFANDNLVDIMLKNVWDKLTKMYNSDFISKRIRRIEELEGVLQNIKS